MADGFCDEADNCQTLGKSQEALNLFQKALSLNNKCARAYFGVGVIAQQHGDWAFAVTAFQQTLLNHPLFPEAAYRLCFVLQRSGRLQEAVPIYKTILSTATSPYIFSNLAAALQQHSLLNEALPYFLQALQLDPAHCPGLHGAAQIYFQMSKYKEAVEHWNKLIQIQPMAPTNIRFNLGTANHKLAILEENAAEKEKLLRQAVEHYRFCIGQSNNNFRALANLAEALRELGDVSESINYLFKALKLIEERADSDKHSAALLHENIGFAYLQTQQLDKAIHYWKLCLNVHPTNDLVHFYCAESYYQIINSQHVNNINNVNLYSEAMFHAKQANMLLPNEERYSLTLKKLEKTGAHLRNSGTLKLN